MTFFLIDYRAGTVVARKFCEAIMSEVKDKNVDSMIGLNMKNLNEREVCGMHYMAGFVLHKLYLKHRNSKNYKSENNQQIMALLMACKSDTLSQKNAKLVNALSRGGLWSVTDKAEKIFLVREKYFCIKSDVSKRTLSIFSLVKSIMEYKPIKDIMCKIVWKDVMFQFQKKYPK